MYDERPSGDSGGRRIARRRAMLLAEAHNVARSLEVLLERVDFETKACTDLIKAISRQEARLC